MISDNFAISLDVIRAYFVPEETISWPCSAEDGCTMEEARNICEDDNAGLADITSEKDLEAVQYILQVQKQHYFWIGLQKV